MKVNFITDVFTKTYGRSREMRKLRNATNRNDQSDLDKDVCGGLGKRTA